MEGSSCIGIVSNKRAVNDLYGIEVSLLIDLR